MAIERTATNLAKFCLEVVGTPYWYGTFGQKGSESLYNQKKKDYPTYYQFPKNTYTDDYGKRVCDCAGLVKWFLWSDNMNNKNPTYKASEDWGATTFYKNCSERGTIKSLPANKIGICVFKGNDTTKTHMGVIVDQAGTVVDARGHNYGTVKNTNASSWGYWGKCRLIKYDATPTPQPTPTPTLGTYQVTNIKTFLSIRNRPELTATEVGRLFNNAIVTVTEISGTWAKISGNCWCSTKYLKKI